MSYAALKPSLLHADAGRQALNLFTAYVFAVWTVKMLFDPVQELAHLPLGMAEPVGVLNLLTPGAMSTLLTEPVLWMLRGTAVVLCALCLVPRMLPFAGPVACVVLTIHQSLVRSFGIINHAEIAVLVAAYILVLFAWYRRVNPEPRSVDFNPYAVPLLTIALVLTTAYGFVGVNRLLDGGLYIFIGDSLPNYILSRSHATKGLEFEIGKGVAEWPALWLIAAKLGFAATTVMEATAPLCLVNTYYRYIFLLVMIPFHIATVLTMQISFHENLLLYLVLLDFSRWLPDVYRITGRIRK